MFFQSSPKTIALQSVLSQGSADLSLVGKLIGTHHPITCNSVIGLEEDGTMTCDHSSAPPDNPRNQAIIDATIAILIIEMAGSL